MNLPKDFKEFVESLNAHNVEYVIVGGYAVAFYGYARFTGDLDVLVNPTKANAEAIMRVLVDFGFGDVGLCAEDFCQADVVIQLGRPPLRIDLITSIDAVTSEEAIADAVREKDGATTITFISREHLLRNKKKANRPKDIADLEYL